MFRTAAVVLLLAPGFAAAQPWFPAYSPPTNPLAPIAPYRFQPYVGVPAHSVYGQVVIGQPIPYYSPLANVPNFPLSSWYLRPNQLYTPPSSYAPWGTPAASYGYMSGGSVRSDAIAAAQREATHALQQAALQGGSTARPGAAKDIISDLWVYEKLGLAPPAAGAAANPSEQLVKAIAAQDEADVASGEALNLVLAAVVTAESKGAKGPSAFLPPPVLKDIRFAGGPAGDALNLLRQAHNLPFPAAFNAPDLRDARDALARDFAAAAAPLLAGKPADAAKVTRLELAVRRAEDAAAPVVRTLPFDEAAAARRFLNHLAAAVAAMRGPSAVTLVDPSWPTAGASVADLVRHMARHKLLFAPAPRNGESAYLTLQKALVTYLFVLSQPQKK